MKKTLLILLVFISLNAYSQSLPNGNLENWENYSSYDEPTNWHTPNPYTSFFGVFPVTKSDDTYDGSQAARLETSTILGIDIPGIITLADFSVNFSDSSFSVSGGYYLQENVYKMTGWYKYAGIDGDSANILMYNFKNTEETGYDTIGFGVTSLGNADTWSPFTVFMYNFSNAVPDTFNVLISSSGVAEAKAGSVLFVDSLNIYTNTGVIDLWAKRPKLHVYPNPAVSSVNFESETIERGSMLTIYDNMGKKLLDKTTDEKTIKILINNFRPSVYFYTLKSKNKIVNSGSFIKY